MHPDDEFREAMARDPGVRPLRRGGDRSQPRPRPVSTPPQRQPETTTPQATEEAPAVAVEAPRSHLEQQVSSLERALEAERQAHAQLRDTHQALRAQHADLLAREQRSATIVAPVAADAPRESLLALLQRMGFQPAAPSFAEALLALRHTPQGERVLANVFVESGSTDIAHLMQDKVTWRCDACATDAGAAVVVPVESAACEVCGGSAIEAAASHLRTRCRAKQVRKLLIIGGSPAYHAQLQRVLPPSSDLELRLMRGDKRLDAARAAQQVAWCDRGFIWSSTILDHAVSAVFSGPRISTIPVRGIRRFLSAIADRISEAE